MGQPVGVKRYLTPQEAASYATQTTLPAVMSAVTGRATPRPQAPPPPPPGQTGGIERLVGIMTDAKTKGRNPEQIKIILEKNGATPEQINFVMGGVQGPTVDPSMFADDRLKKAQQQTPKKIPGLPERY
jgi:hypothetical protein